MEELLSIEYIEVNRPGENLVGIDYRTSECYVGVTKRNTVIFPHYELEVQQGFIRPLIRLAPDGSFILVNVRARANEANCYWYNEEGVLLDQFYIGDGVSEVIVLDRKIVVSYFDEGILSGVLPSREGVAVFNNQGEMLFGYNSRHGGDPIIDCYCMCQRSSNTVLFFSYTEFHLVELNTTTFEERIMEVPSILNGSSAISARRGSVYFHSPYQDKGGLYSWDEQSKRAMRVGEYGEVLRGLSNGSFLRSNNKGFAIIRVEK